jgi:hypothetical protein
MDIHPTGLRTKNDCAREAPKQFNRRTNESVLRCTVSSRYLAKTSEQMKDFMFTVVALMLLELFVSISYKHSITIINPNHFQLLIFPKSCLELKK